MSNVKHVDYGILLGVYGEARSETRYGVVLAEGDRRVIISECENPSRNLSELVAGELYLFGYRSVSSRLSGPVLIERDVEQHSELICSAWGSPTPSIALAANRVIYDALRSGSIRTATALRFVAGISRQCVRFWNNASASITCRLDVATLRDRLSWDRFIEVADQELRVAIEQQRIREWQARWELAPNWEHIRDSLWQGVPPEILLKPEVWKAAPTQARHSAIREAKCSRALEWLPVVEFIAEELARLSDADRDHLIAKLPESLLQSKLLFPHLPPNKQAEILWHHRRESLLSHWPILSQETKILFVHLLASQEDFDSFPECDAILGDQATGQPSKVAPEQGPAKFAMRLWRLGFRRNTEDSFEKVIDDFDLYLRVRVNRWESECPLRFPFLLPTCRVEKAGVEYCEARPWGGKTDAWCPRLGQGCAPIPSKHVTDNPIYNLYSGARLHPDPAAPWHQWTMLELLHHVEQQLSYRGRLTIDLVSRLLQLSGYVNRINEIRSRLRCTECRELMSPNWNYAKNLARYRVTIFRCVWECNGHAAVYMNHCWACSQIIDSRESSKQIAFRDENGNTVNRYVCICCGSGPKDEDCASECSPITQGDLCPACGGRKTMRNLSGRQYRCSTCSHLIRLPAPSKLTGPNKERRMREIEERGSRKGYSAAIDSKLEMVEPDLGGSENEEDIPF